MLSNLFVLLTILAAPLYVVRFNISFLPTTLLEVLVGLTVIVFAGEEIVSGRIKVWRKEMISTFSWPALALLLVSAVAVLISPTQYQALGLWRAYFLEPILFYLVLLLKLRRGLSAKVFLIWFLSGAWIAAMAILQKFTGQWATPDSAHELTLGRAAAVFNSANDVPLFLGPVAAVGVVLIQKFRWAWLVLALVIVAVWASGSRGGEVALSAILGLVFIGWLISKTESKWQKIFWRVGVILGGLVVVILAALFFNIDRFAPASKIVYPRPYSGTEEVRVCLWQGTKDLILAHPILGVGLNGFRVDYPTFRTCDSEELQYPHDIFLNVWTELGLAGLLVFAWIYWQAFRAAVTAKARYLVKVGLVAALLYSLVHGLVDVPYFKNDLSLEFWILLAVIAAAKENVIPEFKE